MRIRIQLITLIRIRIHNTVFGVSAGRLLCRDSAKSIRPVACAMVGPEQIDTVPLGTVPAFLQKRLSFFRLIYTGSLKLTGHELKKTYKGEREIQNL
jgi:hypothetical protein